MGLFVFKLPDLGEGAAEAEIVAWRVAQGDQVEEDAPLADIMTDKATVEITSPVRGRVLSLHGAPGEQVPVGAPLVELEVEGEETDQIAQAVETVRDIEEETAPPPEPTPLPELRPAPPEPGPTPRAAKEEGASRPRGLAAPAVRARARALGLDLAAVRGSGPDGRITHQDLDRLLTSRAASPAPAPGDDAVEEVKVVGLRRRIAERMAEAKRNIPHFGYVEETDVTELEALRERLNAEHGVSRGRLTLLPFLMRAVARAAAAFPQINAHYDEEAGVVRRHRAVHIGVATHTEGGLMVPVVRNVQALDLWACAAEVARLAAAARDGAVRREELTGSTITLTSLGRLGGLSHFPVINPPEVAILGPNRIFERPVLRDGQMAVRKLMNLSSAFDHRVVDGHEAAEFVQAVKARLEQPALLFVD